MRTLKHTPTMTIPVMPTIHIIDGIMAKADTELIPDIAEALKYDKEIARPGQWGTKIKRQEAYYIDRRNGRFLCGLLERAAKHLSTNNIQFNVEGHALMGQPPGPLNSPHLLGIQFRPDQSELINIIRIAQRGVIKSPTGSGKTITALGAISMWPNARTLILVHRLDILRQFKTRASTHMPLADVQVIHGGRRPELTGQIVMATIQTFCKYPVDQVFDTFDITVVDEVHRVADRKSQYGEFMQRNLSPVKIGFTATVPPERERLLAMEGLVGPVVGELTLERGQAMGIVAKPFVTLITVPYDKDVGDLRKYREIYEAGVVNNRARNARIIKAAMQRVANGLSCLTIVREVEHGRAIAKAAQFFRFPTTFIHGGTTGGQREQVKRALESKTSMHVVCTGIWQEGIDIPTLDVVIMAGAGKSEIQTMQGVGRGMRRAPGKEVVEVIDFLDPYRYLARHAVKRLTIYKEQGWW